MNIKHLIGLCFIVLGVFIASAYFFGYLMGIVIVSASVGLILLYLSMDRR
mgnify:CR=1 FL=1|tara:strand:+ start:263 stop:412 length:150 start_codon:yes stop_codon:yes gene_type:complete